MTDSSTRHASGLALLLALVALASTAIEHVPKWFRDTPGEKPIEGSVIPKTPTANQPPPREAIPESGCKPLEAFQICWGKVSLGISGGHVRQFDVLFQKAFATPPVVTTNIDVQSSGYAYAIYNSILDPKQYRGSIVEVQFRPNEAPVAFSFIAIGQPAN